MAVEPDGRQKNKNAAPDEILVFSSDFKVAKQTAMEASQLLMRDETVGTVSLQYTKLMRERSLGPSVDLGGFDGCSTEDLQQVYGLDYIDGSHTLGGVESCEQVLSRCMMLIRDIELSTVERQVVLITHNDVAHILQTIFAGVRPGMHRRLPNVRQGEARELKFSASALAAEAGDGDPDDEDAGKRARPHRHLRLYLTGSVGRERQRDVILERVVPSIADLCQRRGGASFAYQLTESRTNSNETLNSYSPRQALYPSSISECQSSRLMGWGRPPSQTGSRRSMGATL